MSDEDEIEDLRQLDEKKMDLGYYYYNEDIDAYLPCSSWEDVPLQDDEVFPHHHQHLLHLLHPLQQENTEWPASPPEISSSDPINIDRIGNWTGNQSENGWDNGYEAIRTAGPQSDSQEQNKGQKKVTFYLLSPKIPQQIINDADNNNWKTASIL